MTLIAPLAEPLDAEPAVVALPGAGAAAETVAVGAEPFAGDADHRRFRARVGALIRADVLPHLAEWERAGTLPREFFRSCGDAGLAGVMAPPEHGGSGLGYSFAVAMAEEFMRHRAAGPAVSLMVQSNTVVPLLARFASPELRGEWLAPLARGEAVGALGATEPSGGSALPHTVSCTAERSGGDWVVSGEKLYITNAPIADVVLVLARTAAGVGPFTMSLLAVPADAAGVERVARHDKLGLASSPTGHLRFDRVRVPARAAVGRPGHGYPQMAHVLCHERLLIAIGSLAYARSLLDETARWSRGVAPALAAEARGALSPLHARLEAARAFALAEAARVGAGVTDAGAASMAKFALCELAQRVAMACVRLRGSEAAWEGSGLEAALRELPVLSIFAGTSETMRELYGSTLATRMRRAAADLEE